MDSVECGQSLAPEWLLFNRELPLSSQDKAPTKQHIERDRPGRRFGKQHSYHHLTHISPSSLHSHTLQSSSHNWRSSDPNPRILNRSKSSPGFDSKDNVDPPKSPDRSSNVPVPTERHIGPLHPRQKSKIKGKPPLMSSRSQPNLFTLEKGPWQQPKFRSPPPSRAPSLLSTSTLISSPSPPPVLPSVAPLNTTIPPPVHSTTPVTATPDDLDLEMEKLKILVPSPSVASAPKPPTRLVSNRKGSHPKPPGRPEKPATPPPNIHFRKATSEPSLLNNGAEDVARKIRAIKVEKAKVALKETLEEQEVVVAKRNNFLMDVFKREKQIQDCGEDVLSIDVPDEAENFSPLSLNSSDGNTHHEALYPLHEEDLTQEDPNDLAQSEPASLAEDEERFLRLLGWVPEEEDHVPELEEEEIAEVRLKLNSQQQVLCK